MIKDGAYALRFSGHPMTEGAEFFIVGIGTLTLAGGAITGGVLSSSTTRLSGSNAASVHSRFSISGSYASQDPAMLTASMTFTQTGGPQVLASDFDIVPAGAEGRYWFISTRTVDASQGGEVVDEVASGELAYCGAA